MRAKAIGPLLGAAAVVALLTPGAAGAMPTGKSPASRASKPAVTQVFAAKGTNGFTVTMTLLDRHRLNIDASGSGGGIRSTEYSLPAPQLRGSDDIEARIGNLGRIDLSFVADKVRRIRPIEKGCRGGRTVVEKGHYVGLISFHGEHGYTVVDAHRAAGEIVRQPPLTCTQTKPPPEPRHTGVEKAEKEAAEKIEEVQLGAFTSDHARIYFKADRQRNEVEKGKHITLSTFVAVAFWHRGAINESSYALSILQKGSTFLTPDPTRPTTEAVIKPPFPFSGSATYSREPGKPASWSGDLKAELPGLGDVPLATAASRATMCASPGCPTL